MIKIASSCFKGGKQRKLLTTLAGEVQGIVTILGTGGGITKIGEERGKKAEGREADGRQMSRAAGPCDSFNQSLGCVLPRSRTNYVQSCYEFKWKPALPSLLRIFFFFLHFSLFSFLSSLSLSFFFLFFIEYIYIYERGFIFFLKEKCYLKEMARGF